MTAADRGNNEAPTFGEMVEWWVSAKFNHEYVDEDYYDHLGVVCDTPIQTKGTQPRIKNGHRNGEQAYCRGRFRVWERDNKKLKENDGLYLLVLYEKEERGINAIHWSYCTPERMEQHVNWHEVESPSMENSGRSSRVTWSHLIDPEDVDDTG